MKYLCDSTRRKAQTMNVPQSSFQTARFPGDAGVAPGSRRRCVSASRSHSAPSPAGAAICLIAARRP